MKGKKSCESCIYETQRYDEYPCTVCNECLDRHIERSPLKAHKQDRELASLRLRVAMQNGIIKVRESTIAYLTEKVARLELEVLSGKF